MQEQLSSSIIKRAQLIAVTGGIEPAITSGQLPRTIDTRLSELIVLGLLRQNVRTFFSVFGHGSTEIGEMLRIYEGAGLLHTYGVRSEIEASHAAAALRWVTGEKACVITSIGPGALQALAASIVPASDGIGVWYLLGDETTEDEGPNMQQIPNNEQNSFLKLFSTMGRAYTLHTPYSLSTALQRGLSTTDHPTRPGSFFLLMPMNTQVTHMPGYNLDELPNGKPPQTGACGDEKAYLDASEAIKKSQRIVVKIGGGARNASAELLDFIEQVNAVIVHTPLATGIIPYTSARNMTVGGSKGSLCGNYAMENADLLIAVGTRAVCQSDCSRTGYHKVQHVININTDQDAAMHYNKTTALVGDAAATLREMMQVLKMTEYSGKQSTWLADCTQKKKAWEEFKNHRYQTPTLYDETWGRDVLTQPAAIKIALEWAKTHRVINFFDAGDVQANGFQIAEDETIGSTYTESGASYMGFAVSALLAGAAASKPFYGLAFSGDGSFTMNPQILIDGVEHKVKGCILLFDNRRMGAISGLQNAQFGIDYRSSDSVQVDYMAWANAIKGVNGLHGGYSPQSLIQALDNAREYEGLSLIHIPVYYGPDELGGMGVFGRWNVGNWVEKTQALRHQIGL